MGKKGRRPGKNIGGGSSNQKKGPGKARRERAVAAREIEERIQALASRLGEELHDVDIFAPLKPLEDCPICFVPMGSRGDECLTMPCCCKHVCGSCLAISDSSNGGSGKRGVTICPLCRTEIDREETRREKFERLKQRAEANDTEAMEFLADMCRETGEGVQKDEIEELRNYLKAAELESLTAICEVAECCIKGVGIDKNEKLAMQLAVSAAKKGSRTAHYIIGFNLLRKLKGMQMMSNDDDRGAAVDHFMHGAKGGDFECMGSLRYLNGIRTPDGNGLFSDDDFLEIDRQYQAAKGARWSEEREAFLKRPAEFWK